MTDQELLQAMSKMMDEKLSATQKDIMQSVAVLMDADFNPKFNLLAEEMQNIKEELHALSEAVERVEDKVTDHEIKLKIIN